jgi:hypothetical protein
MLEYETLYELLWRAPNSLRDSNVNPKQKTTEEQGFFVTLLDS